jgi:hypothetical protein
MKVVKKGRKQKGWSKEFECTGNGNGGGGCGAILLVEQDDFFKTERSYMGRDIDYFITFQCPDCEVLTDVPEKAYGGNSDLPSYDAWKKMQEPLPNYGGFMGRD